MKPHGGERVPLASELLGMSDQLIESWNELFSWAWFHANGPPLHRHVTALYLVSI